GGSRVPVKLVGVSATGRRRWTTVVAIGAAVLAAAACSSPPSAHPPTTRASVATVPALSATPSLPVPSTSARPSTHPTPSARPVPSPTYRLPADALLVGPGHRYAKPCQAIAAAKPGATIGIDAKGNGTYDGDVCA